MRRRPAPPSPRRAGSDRRSGPGRCSRSDRCPAPPRTRTVGATRLPGPPGARSVSAPDRGILRPAPFSRKGRVARRIVEGEPGRCDGRRLVARGLGFPRRDPEPSGVARQTTVPGMRAPACPVRVPCGRFRGPGNHGRAGNRPRAPFVPVFVARRATVPAGAGAGRCSYPCSWRVGPRCQPEPEPGAVRTRVSWRVRPRCQPEPERAWPVRVRPRCQPEPKPASAGARQATLPAGPSPGQCGQSGRTRATNRSMRASASSIFS